MHEVTTTKVEDHRKLLQSLKEFCFGNGNKGVNMRIDNLESFLIIKTVQP